MKRILAAILVALSVGLNIAFLAGWAMKRWPDAWLRDGPAAAVDEEPKAQEIWHPMHRRLGLGRQQWQRLEPQVRRFYDEIEPIQLEISELRDELIGLLAAPDPDLAAIEDRQERISKLQAELQDLIVEQLLKEKQALTEEQQKQLFDTLRKHESCPHGPGAGRRGPGPRRHGGAGHRRGH